MAKRGGGPVPEPEEMPLAGRPDYSHDLAATSVDKRDGGRVAVRIGRGSGIDGVDHDIFITRVIPIPGVQI